MSNRALYFPARLAAKRMAGKDCQTMMFDCAIDATPGQFVMIWIPGIDEIPLSISHMIPGQTGVTVKVVGEATDALCSLEQGARVGIRGPFGTWFEPMGSRAVLIAGGIGAAPLLPLAGTLLGTGCTVQVILGARTADELILREDFGATSVDLKFSTDDGSEGFHGTTTDLLDRLLSEDHAFDSIYCCGPERMIVAIRKIAHDRGIPGQAALERLMKCGIGLCGSCAIDGKLVCRDGPVFDLSALDSLDEFGRSKRDAAGRLRPILE